MREYKFRGKRINNKDWVYGYYFKHNEQAFIFPIFEEPYQYDQDSYEVIPETVGQYTGQIYKKNVELYEDDIVEIELYSNLPTTKDYEPEDLKFRLYCEFGADSSFYLRRVSCGSCYSVGFGGSAVKRKEVIGNKHDNPELLRGE